MAQTDIHAMPADLSFFLGRSEASAIFLLPELALNTAQFAKSLAMLGSSEDNTALSQALSQLAEVEEKIEQLHQEQANNDFFLLAELLSDYIRLLAIVRVSLSFLSSFSSTRLNLSSPLPIPFPRRFHPL